jgi:hypothetical protein
MFKFLKFTVIPKNKEGRKGEKWKEGGNEGRKEGRKKREGGKIFK